MKHFIDKAAVIWTIFNDNTSNHPDDLNVNHSEGVVSVIDRTDGSTDGEVIAQYPLWDSLVELVASETTAPAMAKSCDDATASNNIYAAELGLTGENVVYREFIDSSQLQAFELGMERGSSRSDELKDNQAIILPSTFSDEQISLYREGFSIGSSYPHVLRVRAQESVAAIKALDTVGDTMAV
ncbi:hypothetical protein [Neptuniibacter sp. QD37_11]|uniref:hypothetical protein n=1 Tax=Neptuniibacter sp. QD37_11 TaxID=3398209 RepID=UPI0039F57C4D